LSRSKKDKFVNIGISPIRAINYIAGAKNSERAKDGLPPIANLSMGKPNFPPAKKLLEEQAKRAQAMADIPQDKIVALTAYQPEQGHPDTRKAIVEFYKTKYPNSGLADKDVMVLNGATNFVDVVFRSIKPEIQGRKTCIAVFVPYYPTHKDQVEMAGHEFVPVHIKAGESPDEALKRVVADKPIAALLLSYPSNPLGNYYSEQELQGIMNIVKDNDIIMAVERVYDTVAANPSDIKYPLDIDPKFHEKVDYAEATSLAKGFSVPGYHVAYGFASEKLFGVMKAVFQKSANGVGIPSEIALQCVLDLHSRGELKEWETEMQAYYMSNVGKLTGGLDDSGFKTHPSREKERIGTFYVPIGAPNWLGKDIPDTVVHKIGEKERKIEGLKNKVNPEGSKFRDGADVAKFLLEGEFAAFVPLVHFGETNSNYFRASCAVDSKAIEQALSAMKVADRAVITGRDCFVQYTDDGKILAANAISPRALVSAERY
jgi:aspartate/methionine/tyrosine aminotransferase